MMKMYNDGTKRPKIVTCYRCHQEISSLESHEVNGHCYCKPCTLALVVVWRTGVPMSDALGAMDATK